MSMVEIGIVSIWEASGKQSVLIQLMQGPEIATTTFADWLKTVRSAAPSDIPGMPVRMRTWAKRPVSQCIRISAFWVGDQATYDQAT